MHEDTQVSEQRPIEITITLKGDDSSYKQKQLLYETLDALSEDTIKKLIETARREYHGEIDEVIVKLQINWQ